MENYSVNKIGAGRTKPIFFDNKEMAMDDAKRKSLKYGAEYSVLKGYKKEGDSSTYYMEWARFLNGRRTK